MITQADVADGETDRIREALTAAGLGPAEIEGHLADFRENELRRERSFRRHLMGQREAEEALGQSRLATEDFSCHASGIINALKRISAVLERKGRAIASLRADGDQPLRLVRSSGSS